MCAEQLVIDLPAIHDLSATPPWVWWAVAVAVAVWYPLAGRFIYHMRRKDDTRGDGDWPTPPQAYAWLWAFSPAACVLLGLMAVVVVAFFVLWTVGHFASLGAIPSPWEKAGKPVGGKMVPPQGGSGMAPPTDQPTAGEPVRDRPPEPNNVVRHRHSC